MYSLKNIHDLEIGDVLTRKKDNRTYRILNKIRDTNTDAFSYFFKGFVIFKKSNLNYHFTKEKGLFKVYKEAEYE